MADRTGIEWTDASWNPVVGCSLVSPGCTNCYAMGQAARIVRCSEGLGRPSTYDGTVETVKGKPVWTGKVALASEATLTQPLRWKRPRRIFVNSMGDLFHEDVPDAWIDRVFAVMALAPQHTYQILTKRSARMRRYFSGIDNGDGTWLDGAGWRDALIEGEAQALYSRLHKGEDPSLWLAVHLPLPNVWLGVSAEDQRRADERIPDLLATPAAIRFVSAEPLLGPIDFQRWIELCHAGRDGECSAASCPQLRDREPMRSGRHCPIDNWGDPYDGEPLLPQLDWIIVGGESGPNARPMHPDWARSIRDQCAAAGTAFFFKQWGEFRPLTDTERGQACGATLIGSDRYDRNAYVLRVGKARAGRLLDGVTHDAMPEVRHG
jgi:protein gp37